MTVNTATQPCSRPLSFGEVEALVGVEYEFVMIDTDITTLIERIASLPIPGGSAAIAKLARVRSGLVRVLRDLDPWISDAANQHKALTGPVPF